MKNKIAERVKKATVQAFSPALKTALWVIKLTIPITLGIAVLRHLGVVAFLADLLAPLFRFVGLSGESALAFITAAVGNIYSGVAVMATIGVDFRSAVILAVMSLICHNLIIETAIQTKAGASPWRMAALRIGMAFVAGFGLNLILPADIVGRLHLSTGLAEVGSWGDVFTNWGLTLYPLLIKMLVLIVSLNILQSILREFKVLDIIAVPLRPVMRIFGLPLSTSFLWIICNVVGITYGGAAIIDEVERGDATPADARLLNTHVAISHSLLEDTIIFISIGIPLVWLLAPRILLAILAVWTSKLKVNNLLKLS